MIDSTVVNKIITNLQILTYTNCVTWTASMGGEKFVLEHFNIKYEVSSYSFKINGVFIGGADDLYDYLATRYLSENVLTALDDIVNKLLG